MDNTDISRLAKKLSEQQLIQELAFLKKELRKQQKNYDELYNLKPLILFTLSLDYIINNLNVNATLFLQKNHNLLINHSFLNYLTTPSQSFFKEQIAHLGPLKREHTFEIDMLPFNGSKATVVLHCTLKKNNLVQIYVDDSSFTHKRECSNLKNSLNLISNLCQEINDAIAVLDDNYVVKVINSPFKDLFHKVSATPIEVGMNFVKNVPNTHDFKNKLIDACQEAFAGEKTQITIENPIQKSDTYYCYIVRIFPLYNPHYQKNELILRIKDLTAYKLEERTQHKRQSDITLSTKTTAMGEMALAFAHEVNQPLTAIATYSRSCLFLMNRKEDNLELRNTLLDTLEKIALQAELSGRIIHNMKNFMHCGNLQIEETNINLLIKESLAIFNYELYDFKMTINLNLMENPPMIWLNRIHIMQVILNLARNSMEAFQRMIHENPVLTLETNLLDNQIQVQIRDNGPGIPSEFRSKILGTYFTTKASGMGIGLGICRTLIERHGGKFFMPRKEQQGACFAFTLPIKKEK